MALADEGMLLTEDDEVLILEDQSAPLEADLQADSAAASRRRMNTLLELP